MRILSFKSITDSFSKAAIQAESRVEGLPDHRFADISAVFRKGIFDIKADTYVEANEGVPFIRIGDLKDGLIQKTSTAWISETAHSIEAKTALKFGDLVLSKTAYPAAAMVNLPECNVSQDTIAIQLNAFGKKHFQPGYIAAFLNAQQGHALMARQLQGNVQQHLSLEDGRAIRIPEFDAAFQRRVHGLLVSADDRQNDVTAKQKLAEAILLTALGLADWTPPEPVAYQQSVKAVHVERRMDAEHFDPRHLYAEQVIAQSNSETLGNLADFVSY